jgi:hypothetical protein
MPGTDQSVAAALTRNVRKSGLALSGNAYDRMRTAVERRGRELADALRADIGDGPWDVGLASLGRSSPHSDAARILGFGSLFAEHATGPLGLRAVDQARIASLGGLANFVVATFDQLVDGGQEPDEVLSTGALVRLLRGDRVLVAPSGPSIVADLTALYARRLAALAPERSTLDDVAALIERAYRLERLSLGPDPSWRVIRDKAAVPFVLLVAPAWRVASSRVEMIREQHLRWAFRTGDFFGWLDDAIDVDADVRAHRRNRVANLLARGYSAEAVAAAIDARGLAVRHEWRRLYGHTGGEVDDVLRASVTSWLAGGAA